MSGALRAARPVLEYEPRWGAETGAWTTAMFVDAVYSAFLENDHFTPTGLAGYLRERSLTRLFLCGLAYDFCVRFSAVDGKSLGFETIVIEDATKAVNLQRPGGLSNSIAETNAALATAKVQRIPSAALG